MLVRSRLLFAGSLWLARVTPVLIAVGVLLAVIVASGADGILLCTTGGGFPRK